MLFLSFNLNTLDTMPCPLLGVSPELKAYILFHLGFYIKMRKMSVLLNLHTVVVASLYH